MVLKELDWVIVNETTLLTETHEVHPSSTDRRAILLIAA
jgi:hypothetical protein